MKHNHPDKIIFLDIDGVLSTHRMRYQQWDEEAMDNYVRILSETSAKTVVSSSWRDRDNDRMIVNFREHGCREEIIQSIIGITCHAYRFVIEGSSLPLVRGNEIKYWVDRNLKYPWHETPSLDDHYSIRDEEGRFKKMNSNNLYVDYTYVILDDDSDMLLEQKDLFIQTLAETGITSIDADKAIQILNNAR